MERLTAADLARMRAEHVPDQDDLVINGSTVRFCQSEACYLEVWPCDAALLLAELDWREQAVARGTWPIKRWTIADIVYEGDIGRALCGPSTSEELPKC